jgi:leucine dehydrogenase
VLDELLKGWDGEELVVRYDRELDTWMLIAVHSTRLGPAGGGTRMRVYGSLGEAAKDALRLSGAMTVKMAVAGLPLGGGKAVLAVPDVPALGSPERRELMLRYGSMIEALGGTYLTACDMNTVPQDMDVIGERTSNVFGRTPEAGGAGSSAPATGVGVFHAMRATAARAFGSDDLSARSVLIQGVGGVGGKLAELVAETGARLLLTDVDPARAEEAAKRLGATAVPAETALRTEVDIVSPCAIGGILNAESIPLLRCRAVVGGANNQLAEPADAERLRERGILYAPDFVVNAGGVLVLGGLEMLGWTQEQVDEHLRGIGDTLTSIFETADAEGITTEDAAEGLARERIEAGPARS